MSVLIGRVQEIPERLVIELLIRSGFRSVDRSILDVVREANANPSLTPAQKLDFILRYVPGARYAIQQGAFQQFNLENLPALVFFGKFWRLVDFQDGELWAYSADGEEYEQLNPEDLPVGVALSIKRQAAKRFDELEQFKSSTKLIRHFAFEKKRWLVDICIATLLVNVFAVFTSLFAMQVYDRVVPTLALNTLYALVTGVAVIYATDWILKIIRARILDSFASQVDKKVSAYLFDHLLHVQLDKLPQSLGSMSAQISGLDAVRQFFSSSVVFVLVDLPFAILFLGVVGIIGGPIAYIYLGFFILSIGLAFYSQLRSQALIKQQVMRSNERLGALVDSIKGNDTIRSTRSGKRFLNEWNDINLAISETSIKQKAINNMATSSSATLGSFAYVIAIVSGVHMIGAGELTMGSLIACSILGGRILGPVGQAVGQMIQYEQVRQSISMVDKLLELPREREPDQLMAFPDVRPSSITLEGVRFSYANAKTSQLEVPYLQVSAGERLAILGPVGAGKSTLLKIMAGLFKASEGHVRAGYVDLWELDPYYVARNISYLPQSIDLFKGTLRSNISLGQDVSDSRLMDVCQALGVDDIAKRSEKGMDLLISEGGSGLSVGQRQLIGLSRLFLNGPAVWILDEPTAALDSASQARVVQAFQQRLRPTDILIFATHNPALAKELATRVLIMGDGKIQKDAPIESLQVRLKSA
jgi:ATP-binding cassette subfamily C protein LapB